MNKIHNLKIGSLLVVLVLPTSLTFAAGSEDFKGANYAHCAEKEFVQAKSGGFSGDDLYDEAADLTSEEVNYAINFPCEEAGADQLGSGTFSGDDLYDEAADLTGEEVNYGIIFPFEQAGADQLGSGTFSSDDVVAYDWPQLFGNGPLENLKDPEDVVVYRMARFHENNGLLNTQ